MMEQRVTLHDVSSHATGPCSNSWSGRLATQQPWAKTPPLQSAPSASLVGSYCASRTSLGNCLRRFLWRRCWEQAATLGGNYSGHGSDSDSAAVCVPLADADKLMFDDEHTCMIKE